MIDLELQQVYYFYFHHDQPMVARVGQVAGMRHGAEYYTLIAFDKPNIIHSVFESQLKNNMVWPIASAGYYKNNLLTLRNIYKTNINMSKINQFDYYFFKNKYLLNFKATICCNQDRRDNFL